MNPIPKSASGITPAWLTSVLRSSNTITNATVTDCEINPIGEGVGIVGQLLRIQITYDSSEPSAPKSLVAKPPSTNPQNDRNWGEPGKNAHEKYSKLENIFWARETPCATVTLDWITFSSSTKNLAYLSSTGRVFAEDQVFGISAMSFARAWSQKFENLVNTHC